MSDTLHCYTIYFEPSRHPEPMYVVREFEIVAGPEPVPLGMWGEARSVEEARKLIPPSADSCFRRQAGDDRSIQETWF